MSIKERDELLARWLDELREVRADDALAGLAMLRAGKTLLWPDTWVQTLIEAANLAKSRRENEVGQARREKKIRARCQASGEEIPDDWQNSVSRMEALKGPKPIEYKRRLRIMRKWYSRGKPRGLAWQLEQLGEPTK